MTNESNHTQGSASLCFISVCFLTDVDGVGNSLIFSSSLCAVLGWGCSLQQWYPHKAFFLLRIKATLRTLFPSESTNAAELLPALAVTTQLHRCEGHGLTEIRGALAQTPVRPGLWFDSSAFSRGMKMFQRSGLEFHYPYFSKEAEETSFCRKGLSLEKQGRALLQTRHFPCFCAQKQRQRAGKPHPELILYNRRWGCVSEWDLHTGADPGMAAIIAGKSKRTLVQRPQRALWRALCFLEV